MGTAALSTSGYHIALFDGLRVTVPDGTMVARFRTRKTGLLLAYLALFPRRHAREALIEQFWSDLPLEAGRDNLSGCLSSLRRHFAPSGAACGGTTAELVGADRNAVWLNTDAAVVDTGLFERALGAPVAASPVPAVRRAALEAVVALYPAPLLPDVYEEWAMGEQARLAERFAGALAALAEAQRLCGDGAAALTTAVRARQADPYNEATYATEMRLHAGEGKIEAGIAVFDRFAALLRRELDCPPSRALVALRDRLPALAKENVEPAAAVDAPVADPPAPVTVPPPNAALPLAPASSATPPAALNRLWGRDAELDAIAALLSPEDYEPVSPRLLTITGTGGVGKTRLALAVAERLATCDPHRARFYLPLADLSDARLFLSRLQQTLGIGAEDDPFVVPPTDTGGDRFRAGAVLVLDNLEHLLTPGDDAPDGGRVPALLRLLLERLPGLTVLATSRRVCGIGGEQEFPLAPLAVPGAVPDVPRADVLYALGAVPSIALFVDRARAVRPDFVLTPANAPAVAAICRRLEGLPLALEMAAAQVRTLTPAQISERFAGRAHELQSRRRDLPARHRSLRAALEWGWELLEPELRPFFVRLSVFRGAWTLAAAEAVTGDPDGADALGRLQEHSLVQRVLSLDEEEARFRLLEPIREWGLEKLGEDAAALRKAQARHAAFFVEVAREARGKSSDAAVRARFRADEENCVAAFAYLQVGADGDALGSAVDALRIAICLEGYWNRRGLHVLVGEYLAAAIAHYRNALAGSLQDDNAAAVVFADALHSSAYTARHLGRLSEADATLAEAGARFERLGERVKALRSIGTRGVIAMEQGDLSAAFTLFTHTLTLAREWGEDEFIGTALLNIGGVAHEQGDFVRARECYAEALPRLRTEGSLYGCVCIFLNQATLALQEGAPDRALAHVREGIETALPLENPRMIANLVATAAAVAARKGQAAQAVRLFAAADRIIADTGAPLLPTEIRDRDLATGGAQWRGALSPAEAVRAEAEGRAMTFDEAVGAARGGK